MRGLSQKIGIALLTFLVGVILTFIWFAFEPKISRHLGISEIFEPEVKTPPVEPKLINLKDPSYLQGKKDAEIDLKAGNLVILVKGQTYFQMVLTDEFSRYNVKIKTIGCNFKEKDEKHLRGYNEISKAAIEERIGKSVFEEAMRKATERGGDPSQ